jgi:hypothetical protein
MTLENTQLLHRRQQDFSAFYAELLPCLVDFVGKMGIQPSHEVLNHAVQLEPFMSQATAGFFIENEDDRTWFVARMGYYIGEYFVQKYAGCWYVNEIPNSRYFARFVVGKFNIPSERALMLDPFEVAAAYVSEPPPRALGNLLKRITWVNVTPKWRRQRPAKTGRPLNAVGK